MWVGYKSVLELKLRSGFQVGFVGSGGNLFNWLLFILLVRSGGRLAVWACPGVMEALFAGSRVIFAVPVVLFRFSFLVQLYWLSGVRRVFAVLSFREQNMGVFQSRKWEMMERDCRGGRKTKKSTNETTPSSAFNRSIGPLIGPLASLPIDRLTAQTLLFPFDYAATSRRSICGLLLEQCLFVLWQKPRGQMTIKNNRHRMNMLLNMMARVPPRGAKKKIHGGYRAKLPAMHLFNSPPSICFAVLFACALTCCADSGICCCPRPSTNCLLLRTKLFCVLPECSTNTLCLVKMTN